MARGNAESLKGKGLLGLRKGSSEKNGAESLAFRPAKCSSLSLLHRRRLYF